MERNMNSAKEPSFVQNTNPYKLQYNAFDNQTVMENSFVFANRNPIGVRIIGAMSDDVTF